MGPRCSCTRQGETGWMRCARSIASSAAWWVNGGCVMIRLRQGFSMSKSLGREPLARMLPSRPAHSRLRSASRCSRYSRHAMLSTADGCATPAELLETSVPLPMKTRRQWRGVFAFWVRAEDSSIVASGWRIHPTATKGTPTHGPGPASRALAAFAEHGLQRHAGSTLMTPSTSPIRAHAAPR